MPSHNTYHLTWVSLTLDVGYLFRAAPARHSHYSLPWTRSPLLTLNMEYLLLALLRLHSHRSLDVGNKPLNKPLNQRNCTIFNNIYFNEYLEDILLREVSQIEKGI